MFVYSTCSWDPLALSKHVHKYTRHVCTHLSDSSGTPPDAENFSEFSPRLFSNAEETHREKSGKRPGDAVPSALREAEEPRACMFISPRNKMGNDFLRVLAHSPVCHRGYVPNKRVTRAAGSGALCNGRNKPRFKLAAILGVASKRKTFENRIPNSGTTRREILFQRAW